MTTKPVYASPVVRGAGRLDPMRAVVRALTPNYWLASLDTMKAYARRQDDTDGERDHTQDLTVTFGRDGDCWLEAGGGKLLRFRTHAGGGASLRTRQALMVLAEAIRLDNEERPQSRATPGSCDEQLNGPTRSASKSDQSNWAP